MSENNDDIRRYFGDLAKQHHQLRRRLEKVENAPADLRNAAVDGGRGLTIKSDSEEIRFGQNGVEYLEGPDPEQPEAPFVDTGGETVKIQCSGLDSAGYPAQRNFRRAHIHVGQDEIFEPGPETFAGYLDAPDGSFTHRLPGGEWYVGVVWENMSGKLSPLSETVLADIPPLVNTEDIEEALEEAKTELEDTIQASGNREGVGDPVGSVPEGVVYYQRESESGPVVAVWQYKDGAWQGLPMTDAVLTSVTTDKLVAGESLIDGVLIKDGAITAQKVTVTAALTTALLQAKKIEAGEIAGNAFEGESFTGGTFTGSTFQTDAGVQQGLKFTGQGIHGWDDQGNKTLQITGDLPTDMTLPGVGNFLTGRFYTNGKDKPGIILNPDYGADSDQGSGVWFSQSGWVDTDQPAIYVDKSYSSEQNYRQHQLVIRAMRLDSGARDRVRVEGGLELTDGGGIVADGAVTSGYGAFEKLESTDTTTFWDGATFKGHAYVEGYLRYSGYTTVTRSSNLWIGGGYDSISKTSSIRASKVNIQDADFSDDRILELRPRTWFDRTEAEGEMGKESIHGRPTGPRADEKAMRQAGLQRIPGLVAEEVEALGLTDLLEYEVDHVSGGKKLSNVNYDRLAPMLIPVIRKQRDRIDELEERLQALEEKMA